MSTVAVTFCCARTTNDGPTWRHLQVIGLYRVKAEVRNRSAGHSFVLCRVWPFVKGMSTGLLRGFTAQFGGGHRMPAAAYPYHCGRIRAQIGDPVDAGHPASPSADEQCPLPATPVGHWRTPRPACLTAGSLQHQHRSPADQREPAGTQVAQRSRFDPVRDPPQRPVPVRPAVPRPLPRHDFHTEIRDTRSLRRLATGVLAARLRKGLRLGLLGRGIRRWFSRSSHSRCACQAPHWDGSRHSGVDLGLSTAGKAILPSAAACR